VSIVGNADPVPVGSLFALAVGRTAVGHPQQELTEFDTISLKLNVDSGDEITFTTVANAPEALYLDELATDVWLDGLVSQRFRVTQIDQTWDADGGSQVGVTAVSYKRLLNARNLHADLTFTQVDQGQIIWQIIQHTQALPGGNYGVTAGAITTGFVRDRSYIVGENLGDLLTKLQQVEQGPFWTVDRSLQLQVHAMTAFPTLVQPIQHGVNARSLQRRGIAQAGFANAVLATGDQGVTTPYWAERPDIATDPRGRWERVVSFPSVIIQQTLVDHAWGALDAAFSPAATWAVELEPSRWVTDTLVTPGQFVTVVVPPTLVATLGEGPQRVLGQVIEVGLSLTADGP